MKKLVGFALLASPLAAFAATTDLFDLIKVFQNIVSSVTPFVIGLAVLVIIWGLFNYIAGAGDEEKRGQAKQYIIWGIIGLFVMVSIWGLVGIISKTANIDKFAIPVPQTVPCPGDKTWSSATIDPITKNPGACI